MPVSRAGPTAASPKRRAGVDRRVSGRPAEPARQTPVGGDHSGGLLLREGEIEAVIGRIAQRGRDLERPRGKRWEAVNRFTTLVRLNQDAGPAERPPRRRQPPPDGLRTSATISSGAVNGS